MEKQHGSQTVLFKKIKKTRVKFHYVDQAFLTGETYHKSKSYLFSILDDTTVGFASIITVVNRLSYAKNLEIQNDVKSKFFSFIKLHYPGSKEGEHDCELCQLEEYYKKLSSRTVLDSCNDAIIKNRKKLIVVQKNKKDSNKCSKRGFIRLVLTHEIYYRIAEIVQHYAPEAYDFISIYSEMEKELDGLFEQLSQNRPRFVHDIVPRSKINQKIDDWLTLRCMDAHGGLSGELNVIFMEKLRVDKKISFLKVISSPPLSKYISIRQYAHKKLLNELHLIITRANNEHNDFVFDDLKLIKSILKSLSFLKSNALVRKEVIVGVWRALGKVLCNLEKERTVIEKYLQIIEKHSNEIKNSYSQRNSQPRDSLSFPDYSEEDVNNAIKKMEVLKEELEKDLRRLKEDAIIRDFSQDVQFFIKNSIVEDDAKSTFLGELLRRGEEMKSFDNVVISETRLSLRTVESNDKDEKRVRSGFRMEQRDEYNDLFCCFNSEYDRLFKNDENHFIKELKNKELFQQEYNSFLVWLYYDNTTIIRKTLDNFIKDLKSEAYRDVFDDANDNLIEFNVFKERIDIKKKSFIENVIKREYYYSSFIPYLSNGDGIDYVEKLLYVVYAKEKLKQLKDNKKDIETDTRALMEVFSNIMGAEKAFWIMKQNKKHSEGYYLYPVSLFSPNKNNGNYESGADNNKTEKGNIWNSNYDLRVFKEKYLTNKALYSKKGMIKFPLFAFSHITKTKGERKDLNSKHAGFFIISGLDYPDPKEEYNPDRFLDDELGGNSVVASITFLYNEQDKRCERDFRVNFQESGRLLLLLQEEINEYVLNYLIKEKVFDLWERKYWASRRFDKIYADSSHVFNKVYDEMDVIDSLNSSEISKLSNIWFILANETINYLYSNIERNISDRDPNKHCLKIIDPEIVCAKKDGIDGKIGTVFNENYISILSDLLRKRWITEDKHKDDPIFNNIFINGKPLAEYSPNERESKIGTGINTHLVRTIIAECINNSLYPENRRGGHRGDYETKDVYITISDSSMMLKDKRINKYFSEEELVIESNRFEKKKEFIKNLQCEEYSSTTLTTLQGIIDYLHENRSARYACDYGFDKNNNFYVLIKF